MKSALCLEYQARAQGKSNAKFRFTVGAGTITHWQIKYKPCMDCKQGKKIKKNGGNDVDVEQLKMIKGGQSIPEQVCKACQVNKPLSEFYESSAGSGKYVKECKACAKTRVMKQAQVKKEALKYIGEPPEQPVSNEKGKIVAWEPLPPGKIEVLPNKRTCRKCGYQGTDDDFHKIGQVPTTVCRTCSRKKRSESIAKTSAEKAAPRDREGHVWLNFAEFPEILETIRTDAKRNFRTLQNEILFRLVNGSV